MEDDLELIKRYVEGDRTAFEGLVFRYQKPLYSVLYRITGNHEDAADLLQKTFVKAFTGLDDFAGRSSFKTWLYRIAINQAANHRRDEFSKTHLPLDELEVATDSSAIELLTKKEEMHKLNEAVSDLSERQRLTLMLRVQEGRKFNEIAEIMQCSVGTVKAHYHLAITRLKGILNKKGE